MLLSLAMPRYNPGMATRTIPTEAHILEQVVASSEAALSPEVARFLLALRFDGRTARTIRQLLARNNRGTVTTDERITLERYLRVGRLLDLLHARARVFLQASGQPTFTERTLP